MNKTELKATQSFLKNQTSIEWDYVVVANQAERLATTPSTANKLRLVYQQDNKEYYAIDSGENATVNSNWLLMRNRLSSLDLTSEINGVSERVSKIENKKQRTWKVLTSSNRVKNTWYTNNTEQEMYIQANSAISANFVFLQIDIRKDAQSSAVTINSNNQNGTVQFQAIVTAIVPPGWQYRWKDNGGGGRNMDRWQEYSE